MRITTVLFILLLFSACNQKTDVKGKGVDYDLNDKNKEKPIIKEEDKSGFRSLNSINSDSVRKRLFSFPDKADADKVIKISFKDTTALKKLQQQNDSLIYKSLLDFKKEKSAKSPIQSLSLKKKSKMPQVSLNDIEDNYKQFISKVNLSKPKEETTTKVQNSTPVKLKGIKVALPEKTKQTALLFDKALLKVVKDFKNNFTNLKGQKIDTTIDFTNFESKVKLPTAVNTYYVKPNFGQSAFIEVDYLNTTDVEEANTMYKALVQLYLSSGVDGNALTSEEITSENVNMTLLAPLVQASSPYADLMIRINQKVVPGIDFDSMIVQKRYQVSVVFESL
jgi:hypothetical protein